LPFAHLVTPRRVSRHEFKLHYKQTPTMDGSGFGWLLLTDSVR